MGRFSRDELEAAFAAYQEVAAQAGAIGEWDVWADQFTQDAVYVEHHYGRFEGREQIRAWIKQTMGSPPGAWFDAFPIDWYIIDAERGWVACRIWNRMQDPGDGSIHQADNVTLLEYGGDGLWSYEEDAYNPANFAAMAKGWFEARERCGNPVTAADVAAIEAAARG